MAQSTVSAHIKRLESLLERPLLQRQLQQPVPTAVGERLLTHARQMLRQNALAWQDILDQRLSGVVRLGIPEDYLSYVPGALAGFEARFPEVELEVHCGLSVDLVQQVKAGALDLAITTRQPCSPGGEVLRREPMVWAGAAGYHTHRRSPLPLAVYKQGVCIFREQAQTSLEAAAIDWRIAYTGTSLSGLSSAVRAGLAITILTPSMLMPGMRILGRNDGLPELPNVEIALHRSRQHGNEAVEQLALQLRSHMEEHNPGRCRQ